MTILNTRHDLAYLPIPNRVETVLTDDLAPEALTRAVMMIGLFPNGDFLWAHNNRRGLDIPGGHIEPGETYEEAIRREVREETGAEMLGILPFGYMRMISDGPAPADWPYPHPLSYQQVFVGLVGSMAAFEPTDECGAPVVWTREQMATAPSPVREFYTTALERLSLG